MGQDVYLTSIQQHLKLVHKLLEHRRAWYSNQPKGLLMRNNQIAHTQAMLGLVAVLRGMAAHDPLDWWEDDDGVPF